MRKTFRKDIRIDGNPTVEIDFKALHPSIIAELQGYKLPEFFDPYGLHLEGYDRKTLRSIAKIAFMCIFNSKNLNQATAAVSNELRTLNDEDDVHLPTLWKAETCSAGDSSERDTTRTSYAQHLCSGLGIQW